MQNKEIALFLDFDGTLVEFAPTPNAVYVAPETLTLLQNLHHALKGAIAIISGRQLSNLSHFLPVRSLAMAGLHGLEMPGRPPPPAPAWVRSRLERFCAMHPPLLLEDKGAALALHTRMAPAFEEETTHYMQDIATDAGDDYQLVHGNHVIEIRPVSANKGQAVAAFIDTTPFKGRAPVFIGDDITDEDAFSYVNTHNGISILVGDRPSAAMVSIPSVEENLRFISILSTNALLTIESVWESYHSLFGNFPSSSSSPKGRG